MKTIGFYFRAAESTKRKMMGSTALSPVPEGELQVANAGVVQWENHQLIVAGATERDAIPPSSTALSDGGCGSRVKDPADDAVETTSQLLLCSSN